MTTGLLRERYEPLGVVGRGGEGEVIRALDHLHARQVALKVRRVPDEASRASLLTEARLLLSLSPHPGLPLVREDFFDGDRYVIAMDWIDGTDLEALLRVEGRPGLEPALAIGYLEDAAGALEHLHTHDQPVVHGDVKPANLILTSSGRVVLVDFGLSSTPGDELRRAGTEGYAAPELAAGARLTPASDLYSLAATALTLLTGAPPTGGAPSWGAVEPERIRALERILRPNLATDPERRDSSAAAFVDRLRRWWGVALPSGSVTLVLADVGAKPSRETEDAVDEIARAHSGHCVAPLDDEPVVAAFATADDGVAAAGRFATGFDARVAVVTGEAEVSAGSYRGTTVDAAVRLLGLADRAQVVLDDPTAETVGDGLARELGLAALADSGAWALVSPGLSYPARADTCPYRGLMAFQPDDGDVYFGREEIVASVLERLLEDRFTAVVGASGSGKSSLVRAGLVPALGASVVITPGADPGAELQRVVADGPPPTLVVDQFEEAFTLCTDEAARAGFVDGLLDLWESGSTAVVVALRADFYGRCAEHPRLAAAVAEHQHLLGPMQVDELRRAIERPARSAGLRLEPGLVDAMLRDVEGEPGALPLLSHALYETWSRRDGRILTLQGYRAAGGVRGAIAHTADEVFVGCSGAEQTLMRQLFLRLTELGEGTEDTRRRVPLDELAPAGEEGNAAELLERLTGSRLLVVGDGSAEIAHEALIREWPRLRGWLAEDRDQLRTLRQLAAAARSWDEGGRDDADLFRGARLDAAADRIGGEPHLAPVEREFLEASHDAQERELQSAQRRTRRLRVLLAVVAAALVAAVVAGAFALVQRGSARHTATVAESGRLAAQSREVAAQHPDLGLLLALEAGTLDDSVESRGALLGALEHGARIRRWLHGFTAPVVAEAFSPDGRLLATTTVQGTTLWDTRTWRRVGRPLRSSQGSWEGVDFSPDGATLAIAGAKGRVELWDVATRKELRELADPGAVADLPALSVVRFSPDGTVIAAGPQETNHVTLWRTATGRVIGRPIVTNPPGTGGAQSIAFSPDSRRIAVPGAGGSVGIWDVATGRRVGKPVVIGDADLEEAIFDRSGRTLIATDDSGSVSMVDVASGRPLRPPLSVGADPAVALSLSPDGRLVAAGSFAGTVVVWDTRTGERYGSPLQADSSLVNDVVFSPDGRSLASGHGSSAVVWSMDGSQAIGAPLGGPRDLTTDVAYTPDGSRIVTGTLDGHVVVYDAATRRPVRRLPVGSVVTAVAVDPGGRLVAAGTVDGSVRLFDRATGAAVGRPLEAGRGTVWQLAFSPDGGRLAVAFDPNGVDGYFAQKRNGEVQLWDVRSRSRVGEPLVPGGGTVLGVAFSRDGTLLATGSYGHRVDLWDVATGARHGTPMKVNDEGFPSVAFDRSGELVAAGGAVGPVRVWRVDDQRPAFPPLTGHTGTITGAAFAPDDSLLATTTFFGDTRLWDPATGLGYGALLAASPKPGSLVPDVDLPALPLRNAFSPDGKRLAIGGLENVAMVWELDPAVWRSRACAVAGRNLNREEWRLYLPPRTAYRATCPRWPVG